jgi:hypothetical protein
MTAVDLTPRRGHVVVVPVLPACDFCGSPASWDIPTIAGGSWANACEVCEPFWHSAPGQTGVGVGQRLVLVDAKEEEVHGRTTIVWVEPLSGQTITRATVRAGAKTSTIALVLASEREEVRRLHGDAAADSVRIGERKQAAAVAALASEEPGC